MRLARRRAKLFGYTKGLVRPLHACGEIALLVADNTKDELARGRELCMRPR